MIAAPAGPARAPPPEAPMSIRNLHFALRPRSVAVIGASERPGSAGARLLANLQAGGFAGPIWPVNPRRRSVLGLSCVAGAADLPGPPDLAAIVTPTEALPAAVAELGAAGGRCAVVFGERVPAATRAAMLAAARPHLLRLIGPETLGLMIPGAGLDLSLAPHPATAGRLALVSQSGAIAATIVDWASERGVGLSHVIGLGDMADVDLGDCLDLLAGAATARAILVYVETIPAARKALSAARAAARLKPVIVLKAGRTPAAAAAAATHAGALAGEDAVVDAALRRAGVLRVHGLAEMFAAAETVARFRPLERARLAVVTNGGGAGVLAADGLAEDGGALAALAPETAAALDAVLPAGWSGANPVDILGDAGPERYVAALEAVAADPGVDVTLTLHCPRAEADPEAVARAVAGRAEQGRIGGKPALAGWLGGATARGGRAILRAAGLASYDTPEDAAEAIGHLTDWGRAQAALLRVPDRLREAALRPSPPDARARALAIFRAVAAEGRSLLTAPEAAAALEAYGVPVVAVRVAATPVEVGDLASDMLREEAALAVKLISRDVSHKSDVGGVALDVATPQAAEEAALAMEDRLRAARPKARVDGFALQPMIRRPFAQEVIIGVGRDPVFGPVILFGAGGLAVELLGDTAIALPPLDAGLAGELVARTRMGRALAGVRGRPPADMDALNAALVALSHMTEDFAALRALDVNPLLADDAGVLALDARIEIDPDELEVAPPNPHLAIRPYPASWRRELAREEGAYAIRPILPLDVLLYPDFLARLDDEALRMRFMAPRRRFPDEMGLRLTQLDYDRDMAFVALDPEGGLAGVSRLSADPDRETAEYALVVRSDLAGRGLGTALMTTLIDYARAEGIRRLEGMVLAENRGMRGLVDKLGFVAEPMVEEPGVVMTRLAL
jgi:acetyltransferase